MSRPIREVNKTSKFYIMSNCSNSPPSQLKQVVGGHVILIKTMILKVNRSMHMTIQCHGNHCHGNHCHDNQLTVRDMILSANIRQTTHHSIHNLPGHWRVGTREKSSHVMEVASFPGSPRAQTKYQRTGRA